MLYSSSLQLFLVTFLSSVAVICANENLHFLTHQNVWLAIAIFVAYTVTVFDVVANATFSAAIAIAVAAAIFVTVTAANIAVMNFIGLQWVSMKCNKFQWIAMLHNGWECVAIVIASMNWFSKFSIFLQWGFATKAFNLFFVWGSSWMSFAATQTLTVLC